jgi:hypothetical protein
MAHNRLDSLKKLMFSLLNYPQRRREDVKRREGHATGCIF